MKAYATFLIIVITVVSCSLFSEEIVVPERTYVHTYEYYRTYNVRHFPRTEVESQIFSSAIPCLIRFLCQNLPAPDRVPVLIPATHISHNSQYLLKELQSEMSILLLQDEFNATEYNQALSILLLLDDISVTNNMTSHLVNLCGRSCIYVAIITKVYENKDDFMEDADFLVRLLWKKKIANVAIISVFEDSVQLAKSLSFKPEEFLELSPPEFFGSCEETGGWETEKDKIFSSLALNDGIANIAFFEIDPYIIVNDDNQTVSGIEGDLLNSVCESLRLKLFADQIFWNWETDDQHEIKIRLNSNESYDMVLGGLNWSPVDEIDYTFPYKVLFN